MDKKYMLNDEELEQVAGGIADEKTVDRALIKLSYELWQYLETTEYDRTIRGCCDDEAQRRAIAKMILYINLEEENRWHPEDSIRSLLLYLDEIFNFSIAGTTYAPGVSAIIAKFKTSVGL